MDHETEIEALKNRISQLEFQLSEYHSSLEISVEQRDEFLLGATWGIMQSALPWLAFLAVIYIFNERLGLQGWFWSIASAVLGLLAMGAVAVWQEGLREEDSKKLRNLPHWDDRNGQ